MAVTAGGIARAAIRPLPISVLLLLAGTAVLVLGLQIGQTANALFQRTQDVVATVDMDNRQLDFTTWAGEEVSAPLITDCKQRERPPRTKCIAFYEHGDRVLISYDPEEPTRVWVGETPGGGRAALMTAGGVTLLVAGVLGLWWTFIKPRLGAIFSPTSDAVSRRRDPDDRKR